MAKYDKSAFTGVLPSIRCDDRLSRAVRREAKRHKVKVADVIREALLKHLDMK